MDPEPERVAVDSSHPQQRRDGADFSFPRRAVLRRAGGRLVPGVATWFVIHALQPFGTHG
jgi:hypothetical protein